MARFLYCLCGGSGHMGPALPVVQELRRRGHEVAVLTHPNYRAAVENAGATFIAPRDWNGRLSGHDYSPPPSRMRIEYMLRNRHLILNGFFVDAAPQFRDVVGAVETWRPDVLVGNEGTPGAWMAGEKLGIPWVFSSVLVQCYLPSRDLPIWGAGSRMPSGRWGHQRMQANNVVMRLLVRPLVKKMQQLRIAHGLPGLDMPTHFSYCGLSQLYIVPGTTDFDYPRSDLPAHVHYVGPCLWKEPTGIQSWTNPFGAESFVYGTAGTVFNHPKFFHTMIEAAREAKVNLFITAGADTDPATLGPLPSNVRIERYVPQHLIWPHARAMITSASDGGVMGALVNGKPLVVSPVLGVQFDTARRCEHAGVGILVDIGDFKPKNVRRALDEVLKNGAYRARAEALGAKLRSYDGPASAATLLETLAIERRPVTRADARNPPTTRIRRGDADARSTTQA